MTENGRAALAYLRECPAALGRRLGYDRLTDDLHGRWLREMLNGLGDLTLQAHRGSYKTTCLCLALAVFLVTEPDKNVLFLRKTEADVAEVIRQVLRILRHPEFQNLVSWLYAGEEDIPAPPLRILHENAAEITTDCYASPRGAVQLLGMGIGGSLTGKHADLIVTDDIVNLLDRRSPAERERTRAVYMELQNIRNPGGRILNLGTPWQQDDAFALMPPPWRFDCYSTGLLSAGQIAALRAAMEPALFAANYELRHVPGGSALFPEPPQFFDDPGILRNGIAHLDAAYGGGDCTALTCARRVGDTLFLYGRLWPGHVDTVLGQALSECERLLCAPLYLETNADKGYLARDLRRRGVPVRPYAEKMNKYHKIAAYLRKWWRRIRFLQGTDPAYLAQIQDYSDLAPHDDAPDSAACVCRLLERGD